LALIQIAIFSDVRATGLVSNKSHVHSDSNYYW